MQGRGDAVVGRLCGGLRKAIPGTTGFSAINLWRRRQLHETNTSADFLSQHVREMGSAAKLRRSPSVTSLAKLSQAVSEMVVATPWGHHVNLLAKIQQPAQRLYYRQATARFGWRRNLLLNQIKAHGFECSRAKGKRHNLPKVLRERLAEQAGETLKSSCSLDFLGMRRQMKERALEDRLIDKLRDFILE